ncbi:uncharacterized protein LOC113291255 [Papaver somniferum]|uniref:uncharacterized protein LOC113291255 n=1 Tax=Papaver somniferum TaxID=3469 RepID=UPI000E703892|nr:uncharacterized protein LOC113291255 [Papaver somniferum]
MAICNGHFVTATKPLRILVTNPGIWCSGGFGKKSANKKLILLCKNVNPNIIFLYETKMNKYMAARKLRNMRFPCTFNVLSIGRNGGLALSWMKEVQVNIISSSLRGIYVTTTDIIHSKTCHIHFMYGEPNSSLRQAFWEQQCQQINVPLDEPVFFIGDFNALIRTEDKNGGLEVDDPDFENLRNFCSVFNLHDAGFSGPRCTWSNMQQGFNYEDTCMPRPFHFMAMWIEDPTCRDIIDNSWSVNVVGSPAYKLKVTLLSTKKGLRDWNKSSFGNIQTNISTIRKELVDLQIFNPTDTSNTSILKARLEYLYNLEELYWKEKYREVWLLEGLFYQKHWDIVGEAVVDMTQTFFRTGNIAKVFNHTNIALISKVPLAELVTQYRPIGLCNFIYKILSKILDNRLKPFINNIISQNQSAFIPKRSISDNILLANEAIYAVNHNDKVEGITAIKLDMSKAHDNLEWKFS